MIYLDNGSTTKIDKAVLKSMLPYFSEEYGNASSVHQMGRTAREAIDKSREIIAKSINVSPEEVIFTSGTSESCNLAIKGYALVNKNKGEHIITTKFEHHAVLDCFKDLEEQGFKTTYLSVKSDGIVDVSEFKKALRSDTILVSIMHANNEIGTIQPIKEIGAICKQKNIILHVDGAQTYCHIPVNVDELNITMFNGSSHKIHGPKGVDFLYIKKGIKIKPLIHGGGHERGLRAGTENVPAIVGFAKAVEIATKNMKRDQKSITNLRNYLINKVLKEILNSHLSGSREKRLPGNANFWFEDVEGEALVIYLDQKGIQVSTGSACSSKSLEPSHVLMAIGLKPEQSHGSLRVTLSKYTKKGEIDKLIKVLKKAIKDLRKVSATWSK